MKPYRQIRQVAALLTLFILLTGCGSPADTLGQTAPVLSLIHI